MGAGTSKESNSNSSKTNSSNRNAAAATANNNSTHYNSSNHQRQRVSSSSANQINSDSTNTFKTQPYHSRTTQRASQPSSRNNSNQRSTSREARRQSSASHARRRRTPGGAAINSTPGAVNTVLDSNNNRCSLVTPSAPSEGMPCTSCMAQFTLFNKKWKCEKCELLFCEACLIPVESTGTSNALTSSTMCQACFVFLGPVLLRSQLMRLKVRDLMRHIRAKGIENTRGCLTKAEVIDLLASVPTITLLMDDININDERPPERLTVGEENVVNSSSPSPNAPRPDRSPGRSDNANSDQFNIGTSQHETESPAKAPRERKQLRSIENEDDIDKLTVRELKEILVNNFVIIKGLCEKEELVQKAKMLWRQEIGKRKIAKQKDLDEDGLLPGEDSCKICMDAPINCVLLECGHMVSCVVCGKKLSECPVCRQYVVRAVHTFRT